MHSAFTVLDWGVFGAYFLVLTLTSVILSRVQVKSTRDYFVGGNSVPMFAVAMSVLATSQSAATFLGGPEYSYGKDLTFLGFYLSAFLAVIFVAKVLIPRFYAINAVTVYELLDKRYGATAKKQAGVMFLIGRLFASGARLYIGALAISMILFLNITPTHVAISIAILMLGALAYAYFGGVKSVIFSDIIQAVTYIGAGIAVLIYLYMSIDADFSTVYNTLEANNKLQLLDWSMSGGFSVWALLGGWLLLNIAAYGLDQDMTQRALSCKDTKTAQRSLMMSIYLTIPVAILFLFIGLLLYLFYQHPELSNLHTEVVQKFEGEKITIFMYYILHEMPEGMRGLVTVGAVAAALSSSNSVLGAMSSVAIEDLYKPWKLKRSKHVEEMHFVKAGRNAVLFFAVALSAMAMLSYYWQRYTELPLLSFALGVMAFAYTGLLGVFGAAIFTKRGNAMTVPLALIGGFMTVLLLQPYVLGENLGELMGFKLGFAWQILVGTFVAFWIMMMGNSKLVLKTISIVTLFLSIGWFINSPDWEPVIVFLSSVGLYIQEKNKNILYNEDEFLEVEDDEKDALRNITDEKHIKFIDSLPEEKIVVYQNAQKKWDSGINYDMKEGNIDVIDFLEKSWLKLSEFYKSKNFEGKTPQEYIDNYIQSRYKYHNSKHMFNGEFTGGLMVQIMVGADVIEDLDTLIKDLVVTISFYNDDFDYLDWEKRWDFTIDDIGNNI